jgi:CMP-N-acetylneuraminic acid synthetase
MITAVVAVRAGSTRVKDKNIRPFAGSSLLQVKLRQLKSVALIDEIIVSSDSEAMLELARQEGVCAVRRPDEYCDEKSRTFNQVVSYIATNEVKSDVMLWAPCVCPLVGEDRFHQAIEIFRTSCGVDGPYDSVASASLLKEYIFDENGPVNFSIENHVPSQKLPPWHVITNGFFVARRADMARWGFVYGPKPYLLEIDKMESLDIDDENDFRLAEQAYLYFRKEKENE